MSVTREQSLSFVNVITQGKPYVLLEAILGDGNVASAEDFTTPTEESLARASELVAQVREYADTLDALIDTQRKKLEKDAELERRNSLDFGEGKREKKRQAEA